MVKARAPRIHTTRESTGIDMKRLFTFIRALTFAVFTAIGIAQNIAQADQRQLVYLNDDAWINELGTLLYNDGDRDGYFSGLSLSLDADTQFGSFEVYAIIDILNRISPNNIIVERLHTTQPFYIYGRSITDEYRVDIDLVQNYSPDTYDLQIALVDAHSHQILDQVGARDFRNLRALLLESEDYQDVFVPVVDQPLEPLNDNVRVVEYSGGTGPMMFALFIAVVLIRLRRS